MFFVPMTRSANELTRAVDRLFDDSFFDRVLAPAALTEAGARSPAMDVT